MITLTGNQNTFMQTLLTQPAGTVRTDHLAKALGTTPSQAAVIGLQLRSMNLVSSCNDNKQYNVWNVTEYAKSIFAEQARREKDAERVLCKFKIGDRVTHTDPMYPRGTISEVISAVTVRVQWDGAKGTGPLHNVTRLELITPEPVHTKVEHYILWSPQSRLPPTVKYSTITEARKVAKHMAENYPTQTFHICGIVEGYKVQTVSKTVVQQVKELVKV